MNEILEEHLKDALWISLTVAVSFTLFQATGAVRMMLLKRVSESIVLLIGKYADLSAEYGGEFTVSIPRTLLFNYSIILNDNEYSVLIQGIQVFNGTGKHRFSSVTLEAGETYSVRTLGNRIVLTKR
ncbi:MAG: hypothetical protein QW797_00810 [Thermoproteota archaeon]